MNPGEPITRPACVSAVDSAARDPGRQPACVRRLACRARPATRSGSSTPSDTVASRTPAAQATSQIPPCPSARASIPISSRRCRSSGCGKIVPNFATRISLVTTMLPIPHQHAAFQEATGYVPASPKRH